MKILLLLLPLLLFSVPAAPASRAGKDTLVVGIKTKMRTLDITRSTTRNALIFAHHWGDTLVYRDAEKREILPCLAESFELVGNDTVELKLKKGIRFHNGEPFDARAVEFSLNLLKSPESMASDALKQILRVEILDPFLVRIKSSVLNRTALDLLANIMFIYPPRYYDAVKAEGFSRHPVGTGPYRFEAWENPFEIEFTANPEYFDSPKSRPRIPRLKIRTLPEEILLAECLIQGRIDLLKSGNISPEQISFLEQFPRIRIEKSRINRQFLILMDAFGKSGLEYFKDRRVRRAINHAIDKEAIATKILHGHVTVNDSVTTPYHFGHEPEVKRYTYDPVKAGKLLSEAGYPQGFTVDFYTYRDETVAEKIVADLHAVGVKAKIKWFGGRWDALYQKILSGEPPLAYISWGGYSIFDAGAILNPFFERDGKRCFGTTPEIDRMLKQADLTTSQRTRRAIFSKVQKLIAKEAFCLPLWFGNSIAAMDRNLRFKPSYDEVDRYFTASWAP